MNLSAETLHFIEEHRHDDVRTLALQGKKYPGVDMALAVTQISGRQIAEQKIPSWYALSGLLYPRHLSMEQCSSELTAKYKAHLLEGESFADLTGGSVLIAALSPGISSRLIMWKGSQDFVSWLCIISLCWVGAHSDTQPGRGILFAGNASGRLLVFRPCQKRRTRWKDGCHL